MGLLDRWLGGAERNAPPTQAKTEYHSTQSSKSAPTGATARREVLTNALRDTLSRAGIPATWITADMLTAKSRAGESGIHWRLAIRHWDPRLLPHLVALQNALITRVHSFDPVAEQWLMGITWQLALEDESQCPPLPHPASWTAQPRMTEDTAPADFVESSAGVIAGPVHLNDPAADRLAELDRLLAGTDEAYRARSGGPDQGFQATEPASLDDLRRR